MSKSKVELLSTLKLWLQDNVDMETDIEFTGGVDSAQMLEAVESVLSVLNIPQAKAVPLRRFYKCDAKPDFPMTMEQAIAWNILRLEVFMRFK